MTVFSVNEICVKLGEKHILQDITFDIQKNSTTAIVGPNGAGKTTLLRVLSRTLRPAKGQVLFNGCDIFHMPTKTVAQTLAILPQVRHTPQGLTVEALTSYGRFPHSGRRYSLSRCDMEIVNQALEMTHMVHLRTRPLATLSGGEQQRAWIAMAIAQKPEVLILDEPTTFLDIAYQLEILELLRGFNKNSGITIIMVLHDLNHALRYADSVMIIKDKHLRAFGAAQDVLTAETLNTEFSVDGDLHWDHRNKCPFIVAHKQVHHTEAI